MSYYYDEEAVIQDADIEMAHMKARGNYLASLEARGICTHDGIVGLPESGEIVYKQQVGLVGSQVRCWNCSRIFEDDEEWLYELRNL